MNRLKKGIASLALAGSLLGATVVGVGAQSPIQVGGARGLVAAVIQAHDVFNNFTLIDSSFNNLTALNNVLNNSPILNNFLNTNDIDITVGDVSVLNNVQLGLLQNFLNANDLTLDDVVGVIVLNTGEVLVLI